MRQLGAETCIPAMHDGVVRAMFPDYLGQAVIIEHANAADENQPCLSAYAHTAPSEKIKPGVIVSRGDIIATLSDTLHSKAKILPHLHYSIAHVTPDMVYEGMARNDMRDPAKIVLMNPEPLPDWPLSQIDLQGDRRNT